MKPPLFVRIALVLILSIASFSLYGQGLIPAGVTREAPLQEKEDSVQILPFKSSRIIISMLLGNTSHENHTYFFIADSRVFFYGLPNPGNSVLAIDRKELFRAG